MVITDSSGKAVYELGDCLNGDRTNNNAEYSAIVRGLKAAVALGVGTLHVVGDSMMVVKQLQPVKPWKQNSADLRPLYAEALKILRTIPRYDLQHASRERNDRADALGNMALDERRSVEPLGTLSECVERFRAESSKSAPSATLPAATLPV